MSQSLPSAPTGPMTFDGQPAVHLRARDGAQATLLLHGGHLVSWQPKGGDEQLYLSPTTRYGAGQAVRGGVPVCFPQFSDRGPLPKHGFARTRAWTLQEAQVRGEHAYAVLRLTDDDATRALWPHAFTLEVTVSVGGPRIDIELAVTNTGDTAENSTFDFTCALHTYLRSGNVLKAQLEGLQGAHYYDHVAREDGKQQWIDVLTVAQELDRIYWQAPKPLLLRELGRRLSIDSPGFDDTVVWNPGPANAAAMADLPDDDWLGMLCVEAAQIGTPVRLAAGQEWSAMQTLIVRD
jgi:glucose-6-phosphate 1-epimerase